ncbi:hypothetical protein [Ruegeria lacuscaerulensis]|uniref:hypothetical protein n=1 Tax=Ruegeria lacuscaerulensis TaxID=55218 RepID=UPI00147F8DB6|nr:hypothetical protein [Ruegeria lacuscaerulensis]
MYFNWLLIAFFTIALGLGSKQANAQTVEDCAAIADKEIRQECFEAAFKNRPAQEGPSDQENVEQAWADIQSLSEILETSHQYRTLRASPVNICQLAIDSQSVNVFEAKRFDDRYTVDLSQLYSAKLHSLLRFNDTVLIVTERSNPIWLDQQVYTKDGSTFIQKNNAEMREVILTPGNDADVGELVEILQRSISRCKTFDPATLSQSNLPNGNANSTSDPLLGYFQVEDSVGELGVFADGRKCLDWAYLTEIRPEGSSGIGPAGNTAECVFTSPIPQGASKHVTNVHCKIDGHGTKDERSYTLSFEWKHDRLTSENPSIPESRLEYVRCERENTK